MSDRWDFMQTKVRADSYKSAFEKQKLELAEKDREIERLKECCNDRDHNNLRSLINSSVDFLNVPDNELGQDVYLIKSMLDDLKAELAKRDALLEETNEYFLHHKFKFIHIEGKGLTCNCFCCQWLTKYAQLRAGEK